MAQRIVAADPEGAGTALSRASRCKRQPSEEEKGVIVAELFPECDVEKQARVEHEERYQLYRLLRKHSAKLKYVHEHHIKEMVRNRDQYRCRDCGQFGDGKTLDVHRVFPGIAYQVHWCVTLCHDCHARKRHREEEDVYQICWNLYDPESRRLVQALVQEAIKNRCTVDKILCDIFDNWLNTHAQPLTDGD
jgi:hypothetical protein